jgi:hypothetical protein
MAAEVETRMTAVEFFELPETKQRIEVKALFGKS